MNTKEHTVAKERGDFDVRYLNQSVDQMVIDFMREKEIDGLTLSIVQAPYIPRVVGYGFADAKHKRLASVNTMWPIGPISQGFAAVAIMQLYENGQLDLYDHISKWLPELPDFMKDITILDLLHHASGLSDYTKAQAYTGKESFLEALKLVEDHLRFPPNHKIEQSATNFLFLSEIVERASNCSYHDFIWQHQIDFLGLKHTGFYEDLDQFHHEDINETNPVHQLFKLHHEMIDPTETAESYDERGDQINAKAVTGIKGYHDLWASAQDISYWDIALAGGILIHDEQHRRLIYGPWQLADGNEAMAVSGWQFYHHRGLMDIKGTIPGYSMFLSRFTDPHELVCVTLLANKEGIDFTNLARKIAGAFGDLLSTNYDDHHLYLMESQFTVSKTIERLEHALKKRNIPVFAKFDHAKNAREVNMELRETSVLVFGAPSIGTHLMQVDQSIALELPLRIAVWCDEAGSTLLGFVKSEEMASSYGVAKHPIVKNMQKLLEQLVQEAANVYE